MGRRDHSIRRCSRAVGNGLSLQIQRSWQMKTYILVTQGPSSAAEFEGRSSMAMSALPKGDQSNVVQYDSVVVWTTV